MRCVEPGGDALGRGADVGLPVGVGEGIGGIRSVSLEHVADPLVDRHRLSVRSDRLVGDRECIGDRIFEIGEVVGGIVWNLLTWLLGLPSSSSHALFGGLIGAAIAGLGFAGVNWQGDGSKLDGVVGKVILPAVLSSVIAGVVAGVGTWLIYRVTAGVARRYQEKGFRWGQIGSASLVSLAHGTNDAQKTMGVITLALIASGQWHSTTGIPV